MEKAANSNTRSILHKITIASKKKKKKKNKTGFGLEVNWIYGLLWGELAFFFKLCWYFLTLNMNNFFGNLGIL